MHTNSFVPLQVADAKKNEELHLQVDEPFLQVDNHNKHENQTFTTPLTNADSFPTIPPFPNLPEASW